MEKLNDRVEPSAPVLVVANPGTREEKIYFIRSSYITASGAWFHTNERLPRGTYTKMIFRLKYDTEQRTLRVTRYGKVAQTGIMGFAVQFDH
jgi:hypothetical protein